MMKLRSQYVPERIRATTLNLFRVPLNLFVCLVLFNVRCLSPVLLLSCMPHSSSQLGPVLLKLTRPWHVTNALQTGTSSRS